MSKVRMDSETVKTDSVKWTEYTMRKPKFRNNKEVEKLVGLRMYLLFSGGEISTSISLNPG